ncbi:MAG: aminopeptidase P N-terminal domain-containing protein [Pseudomonadota bacterium]
MASTQTLLNERARRRRHLLRAVGTGGIAILPAAAEQVRSRDTHHSYRQNSDFFYFTGFEEPHAVAVFIPGRKQGEYLIFCRDRDPQREQWDGKRVGVMLAPQVLECDDAFPIDDIDEILPGLIEGCDQVYHTFGLDSEFDAQLMSWINQVHAKTRGWQNTPTEFVALDPLMHEMRTGKSRTEIAQMRRAGQLSAGAHVRAMQCCEPGMMEYALEAELGYHYRRAGGTHAFEPIVAGGENACTLHYVSNHQPLEDGDLVLIDSGAELDGYAGDISRTFPVNGRFTDPQREVYEVVLSAYRAAMDAVQPGNAFCDPHDAAVTELTRGLVKLGILKGRANSLIRAGEHTRYFPHRTSHWLGLDVHDVGEYKTDKAWRELDVGNVLTIEPGLYIPSGPGVPKAYRGIGIRVEDDVAVARDGADVISAGAPLTVEDIERTMATSVGE